MMKEALDAAMQIQDDYLRTEILAKITSRQISTFSLNSLHEIWMKVLHKSTSSRDGLFANIGKLMPIIHKVGEEKAISETFYATEDVVRWWP